MPVVEDRVAHRGGETRAVTAVVRPRVEVRALTDLAELKQLETIFAEIWRRDGPPPISADLMRALSHSGNYVVGAFIAGSLGAGLVGFLAKRGDRSLYLHSHILGVLPKHQFQGAGFALKQHQRAWALAQGLTEVQWTFDPLVRRNAYFNVGKLGADVVAYHVDFYGVMGDSINGNGASDRALAIWRLHSERSAHAASGVQPEPDLTALINSGAEVALREGSNGWPATTDTSAEVQLCHVPEDIVALRRDAPALADAWREATRDTFGRALARRFAAVGMTRAGWYVLKRLT